MREIVFSTRFKRDVKVAAKRGLDLHKMYGIIENLCNDVSLSAELQDHALGGNYKECRECHIAPDWLLIYRKQDRSKKQKTNVREIHVLHLMRTGTHSDLF